MKVMFMYRFYNRAGDLLYVGITDNPNRRLGEHSKLQPWWSEVVRDEIERVPTETALTIERDAIKALRPRYNSVHNNPERTEQSDVSDWDRLPASLSEAPEFMTERQVVSALGLSAHAIRVLGTVDHTFPTRIKVHEYVVEPRYLRCQLVQWAASRGGKHALRATLTEAPTS